MNNRDAPGQLLVAPPQPHDGIAADKHPLDTHVEEDQMLAVTTDTAWINRRIRRGLLSPAARGMTAEDAARQHNEATHSTPVRRRLSQFA
ncbi:hypothetical protein [Gordonia sp. 852002-51296_SCH5728562-b]|uniref:hypothetical protein n=1 Tax=Gordonia sp. 852002-51296_SCH5728562-b TaxID=1834101 RepID=UPI0007EA9052|nr:hypothetical protein [Gordonia sp. 852002-51296_SCH5728562-b]OBA38993.1 hypothetical protein A5766_04365 [Gordonia sp. 852002-51296_SCH5728562-b]